MLGCVYDDDGITAHQGDRGAGQDHQCQGEERSKDRAGSQVHLCLQGRRTERRFVYT